MNMKDIKKQREKDIELVDNFFLKKISKKKFYIQPIYTFILFIFISFVIYKYAPELIIDSLSAITTANVTLFAVNLALLVFIVPYFINDRIKYIEIREQIKELRIRKAARQSHLEKLKKVDVRIVTDSQALNYLYFQTVLLVTTFCISVLFLAFVSNKLLVTAVNSSHIVIEIIYIINLLITLGIWMYTKGLDKIYAEMISYETNLLNNSGTFVQVLTNKDIKEIKRKCKQKTKL